MPEQAFATVKVKLGHPTGEYRRGGHVFYVAEPVTIPVEDITPEMASDAWLVITLDAEAPAASLSDAMSRAALDAHAATLGLNTTDAKNKGEVIERIKAAAPTPPSPGMSDADVAALQAEIESLHKQLEAMTKERDEIQHNEIVAAKAELNAMLNRAITAEGDRDAEGDGKPQTSVSGASTVNPVNTTTVPPATSSEGA